MSIATKKTTINKVNFSSRKKTAVYSKNTSGYEMPDYNLLDKANIAVKPFDRESLSVLSNNDNVESMNLNTGAQVTNSKVYSHYNEAFSFNEDSYFESRDNLVNNIAIGIQDIQNFINTQSILQDENNNKVYGPEIPEFIKNQYLTQKDDNIDFYGPKQLELSYTIELKSLLNVFNTRLSDLNDEIKPIQDEYDTYISNLKNPVWFNPNGINDKALKICEEDSAKLAPLKEEKALLEMYRYQLEHEIALAPYTERAITDKYQKFFQDYKGEFSEYIKTVDKDVVDKIRAEHEKLSINLWNPIPFYTSYNENNLNEAKRLSAQLEVLEPFLYMSEEQRKMYIYLLETEGKESASEYMSLLQDGINQAKGAELAAKFIESLDLNDEGKLKRTVANFFNVSETGLEDGVKTFFAGLENCIINNENLTVDDYKKMIVLQYLQENSNFYDEIYEFNSALGNMLPAITTSVIVTALATPAAGTITASVLMGLSAGGNAKHQALVSGHSLLSSSLYGIFVGASEATLGYFLGKVPGISKTSGFTLKNLLMEGAEELSQEWIDAGLQAVILGEDVDLLSVSGQSVKAFIMGVLMAGFLNGGQAIIKVKFNGKSFNINVEETLNYINEHPNTDVQTAFEVVNNIIIEEDGSILVVNPENNTDLSSNNISGTQYQHIVDVISKNNIVELESRILSKINPNMTQLEVLRLLYIELGSKVKYSDDYQIANRTKNEEIKEILYGKEMKLDDLVQDNNIICANWTQLYSQLLLDAGFNENQIISVSNVDSTGAPLMGSHSGMFVKLDDGSFLMADLTAPIGDMTDIYNIKAGNDLTGFVVFTPEQVSEIASYYGQTQNIGNYKKIRSEVSGYDLETLIKGINENFVINTDLVFKDTNGNQFNNLNSEQMKFLKIVNKFLYASEVNNNSKKNSCIELEKAFFSMFNTENKSVMIELDSKLSDSRKNAQELKANIKDLKAMVEAYKQVDSDLLQNDDLSEDFLGISELNDALFNDELHDLNITVLKNYIQQRAMTEGLFYDNSNPQEYSIKAKVDFTTLPPRVVVTVMNLTNEKSKYAFTISNNQVKMTKID